jgi:hypothetical protein
VIEAVDPARCKAIADSPGVDLSAVLAHAVAARRRRVLGDVMLFGCFFLVAGAGAAAPAAGAAVGLAAWIAIIVLSLQGYRVVTRLRDGEPSQRTEDEYVAAVEAAERGNVTVYSGFSPFVGSGVPVGGWSFALDLTTTTQNGGPRKAAEFRLGDLYDAVEQELAELPHVSVERRLFVDGRDVRGDDRFLPDRGARPRTQAPPSLLATVGEAPETSVRHFSCVRVVAWDGDLVLTTFVRFTRLARTLYAEVTYTLLTPVKDKLRGLDAVAPDRRLVTIAKLIGKAWVIAAVRGILSWFLVPKYALERLTRGLVRRRARRRIARTTDYDYGAERSIREEAATTNYRRYFQLLDREMYGKVVERRLLEALVRFLDGHGVDTSELKQRENAILNQGVIISGGDVRFENTAIGQRAKQTVNLATKGATQ